MFDCLRSRTRAAFDRARLLTKFAAWQYHRRFLCPKGEHEWSYFGRYRVCRACHTEEQRDSAGDWRPAPMSWAVSTKSPPEHPTNGN